ncbi:MAG: phosphoribosylanthranilate isomerase [Chitinivibrionales bacterium]|nr:phosphoribosylanthranilate isomerase [Chitinivibrionales bacterium]
MPVRIKICGITRYDDAKVAVNLGVDALGFIFYPQSPRFIHPLDARDIIRRLPPYIARVGVFVDDTEEAIRAIAAQTGVDTIQLHGAEPPALCEALQPFPVIKAFCVQTGFDVAQLQRYPAQGFLLDTWSEKVKGGSGGAFDWSIARRATTSFANIILAGGLNPGNIAEALEKVEPYAVDFNSGLEVRPGIKNPYKMREAVAIVKNWKPTTVSSRQNDYSE